MEKQQPTSAAIKPEGMCEKLFNAFQPTLRPLRRLTLRQQDTTTDSLSAVHSDHHQPVPQSKLPEPAAPPPGKAQLPKAKNSPKPEPLPTPAPPKAEVKLLGAVPQPLPPPPPTNTEVQKPKKGFNERVDEYIIRTRARIRTVSGVGRAPSKK